MLTFVPSWGSVSAGEVSTDDLIGPIQALQASGENYSIIVSDYLPQLRYFLHRFGLLESPYVSLFDRLQGFEGEEQQKLYFRALNFPEKVHYVYTLFSVLVYEGSSLLGEIRIAEGGHISEVRHYQSSAISVIEVYDDRGFLSSLKVFEEGKHVSTKYVDISGQCVFVQDQEDKSCIVNTDNPCGLSRKYYQSLDELRFELLEAELRRQAAEKIVISVQEDMKTYLSSSIFLKDMALSYFNQRVEVSRKSDYLDRFLVLNSQAVIVDSGRLLERLSSLIEDKEKVQKISPFDTRFELSVSQEVKEEVLYIDVRYMSDVEQSQILKQLFTFIYEGMLEDSSRRFKVIARSTSAQAYGLKQLYYSLVQTQFPDEVAILEEFGLDDEGENALPDSFLGEEKAQINFVKVLLKSFKAKRIVKDEQLFEVLHEARILLDLSPYPDLFTQIAGISSGIPQINREATEYVQDNKNGRLLASLDELPSALSYYLDTLKNWQEARVFSVQQIKRYSGVVLSQKVKALFRKEYDE